MKHADSISTDAAILTRKLVEALKDHSRGRGDDYTEIAVSMVLGWALRLGLDQFGWSAVEAGEFARSQTQAMIDADAKGAS